MGNKIDKGTGCRVVIVNGKPESGKTIFENICKEILGHAYCEQRSTVDKIKEIAREGGWNGKKELRDRKFLSDLKDLFTNYNDMPLRDVCNYLRGWEADLAYWEVGDHPHVLFVDDREPEHIERLKQELGAKTLLIKRPSVENQETSNHADANVDNYRYDYILMNDGDLAHLKAEAHRFVNWLFS